MIQSQQLTQFQSIISEAERVVVAFGAEPTFDQLAVASALTQSLIESGKVVTLAAPEKPITQAAFSGLANVVTEIGNQNLTISFEYSEESVDKVSYHIGEDTGKFHLTIKPKLGFPPLDSKKVEFSYTGIAASVIILIGVQDLEDLKQLYFGYEDHFRDASVISIADFDTTYAVLNLNTTGHSSNSEVLVQMLQSAQLPVSAEAATALLRGIEHMTDNFQSPAMTADTFETIAHLMRNGASRAQKTKSSFATERQYATQVGEDITVSPSEKKNSSKRAVSEKIQIRKNS
ncbi:MAG: hypothetical protein WAU07_01010 [Microgenomates group bacterium]